MSSSYFIPFLLYFCTTCVISYWRGQHHQNETLWSVELEVAAVLLQEISALGACVMAGLWLSTIDNERKTKTH